MKRTGNSIRNIEGFISDSYSSSSGEDLDNGFGIDQDTKDNIEKLQNDMSDVKEKVDDMM